MSIDNVEILVVSCDKYFDMWEPWEIALKKYWPDCPYQYRFGCNNIEKSPAGMSTIKAGDDSTYSTNLLRMVEQINAPWIILWIEDRPLCALAKTEQVREVVDSAEAQGSVYVKLIGIAPFADRLKQGCPFGEVEPFRPYRISMTVALWRKDFLMQNIPVGYSAWQLERELPKLLLSVPSGICAFPFGTKSSFPLQDEHLIIKGKITRRGQLFLSELGLKSSRSVLPLSKTVYVWLYKIYTMINANWRRWSTVFFVRQRK